MEKASVFFKRIMLGILLAVLGLTLCLVVSEGLTAHSYLLALVLGAGWAAGLYWLLRRYALPVPRHAALWAMGVCFIMNLTWVLAVRIEPFSDYQEYWDVARALANGTEIPDAWYVAMYPHILGTATILSALQRVFGESVLAVTVFNVVLTTLSCGLVWLLAKELINERAAFLAALLWAVMPCKLMLGSLVFSEPIYTFLILLFFWLFLRLDELIEKRPLPALLIALGLGLLLATILPCRWVLIVSLVTVVLLALSICRR